MGSCWNTKKIFAADNVLVKIWRYIEYIGTAKFYYIDCYAKDCRESEREHTQCEWWLDS